MRDLGVIYDEKLTFRAHTEDILRRANGLFGAGRRFTRDLRCPYLLTKVIQSYVTPILEYGASIWHDRNNERTNNMEKILHIASRNILRTGYRPIDDNYIPFDERLRRLEWLKFEERRIIGIILNIIKIENGDLQTELSSFIERHRIRRTGRRTYNIFYLQHDEAQSKNPIINGMRLVNRFKDVIDMSASVATNKNALKTYFRNHRLILN